MAQNRPSRLDVGQFRSAGLKRPEQTAARLIRSVTERGDRGLMPKGKKPLVVVTRKLPDSVETRMRELFDARLNLDDKPMTPAELAETVKSADVLVPTVTDRIDASVLAKAGD